MPRCRSYGDSKRLSLTLETVLFTRPNRPERSISGRARGYEKLSDAKVDTESQIQLSTSCVLIHILTEIPD